MRKLLLLVLLGLVCGEIYGQDARTRLEAQRKQLQQEIVQIQWDASKNKTKSRCLRIARRFVFED
ncbi:MAG: hypothetical protein CM15mP83_0500 [Flavobacteriaceae bacterium]|nr:MAG: hypothetical protein CM15mP83_0500 [Flavobacteriaceae bacterium]